MRIRTALPEEAQSLSELAFRSKSIWPYEKSALNEYRHELEVFTEDILADSVHVAEVNGNIVGFYGLSSESNKERLYFLFVGPSFIGKGIGKALWGHAVAKARSRGWTALSFYADSYAVDAFYKHQGCQIIGTLNSKLGPLTEMSFKIPQLLVRHATDSDLEHLHAVNSSAKETLRKFYQRNESIPQLESFSTRLIVAELDGQLVGRCEYRIANNECYFLSLGVLDAHRKQGVFKKIFEFFESVAKQEKCSKITCETIEETGNRTVFEQVGLSAVNRRQSTKYRAPDGSVVHEIVMEKALL